MPTYEYKCTECTERFEIEQSIHDDALATLPGEDHEHQLKKVFSPVGIAFRGDGFYKNDARGSKKSASSAATAGDGASKDTAAPSTSSSDTKSSDTKSSETKSSGESVGSSTTSAGSAAAD